MSIDNDWYPWQPIFLTQWYSEWRQLMDEYIHLLQILFSTNTIQLYDSIISFIKWSLDRALSKWCQTKSSLIVLCCYLQNIMMFECFADILLSATDAQFWSENIGNCTFISLETYNNEKTMYLLSFGQFTCYLYIRQFKNDYLSLQLVWSSKEPRL